MILSFSSHGKGQGFGPVSYTVNQQKPDGTQRAVKPEILEGDPEEVLALIDSNKNSWKYTSLVISFKKEEYNKENAATVLKEFEKFAFAGLDKKDYSFLAVLHQDTANPHIHIVVPRKHLGKDVDLNIAPKQQQKHWHAWSDHIRDKLDFDPIESSGFDKSPLSKNERMALSKGKFLNHSKAKIELDKFIKENIASGLVSSRTDIKKLLETIEQVQSVELKTNSISIKINGINKNIRLEGGAYGTTKTRDIKQEVFNKLGREQSRGNSYRHANRSTENETGTVKQPGESNNRRASGSTETRYKSAFRARVADNKKRYKETGSNNSAKVSSLFPMATQKNEARNRPDIASEHTDKHANVSRPSALKVGAASGVAEQIASLQDRINHTADPAERIDLINQVASLLEVQTKNNTPKLRM